MTKNRLLLALALLIGVSLTVFVVLCLQPVRFTEEMANRIRRGMTEAEVVAILGRPAGDYQTRQNYLPAPNDYRSDVWTHPEEFRRPDGIIERAWISDVGAVAVEFDSKGRVSRSYFEGGDWTDKSQSPLDPFRRAVRRLFR